MAFCYRCGAVFSDRDYMFGPEHVCKEEDVPQEGQTMRKNGVVEVRL